MRNLVRAGVPERVAMMITAHETRDIFDRDNTVSEGDLEKAARQVDARIAAPTTTVSTTTTLQEEQQTPLSH